MSDHDILTVPCDSAIDAMNVFELITGIKGIPSEKVQRVGILSLREDRLSRRLRCILHIPTQIMLAESLTKVMTSSVFMRYCTTGGWFFSPGYREYSDQAWAREAV